jgi:translation initiation factor IF-2
MRIYELSKLLKISSKKIIEASEKELGIDGIKNHMSSVSELDAARIQKLFLKTHEESAKKDKKVVSEEGKKVEKNNSKEADVKKKALKTKNKKVNIEEDDKKVEEVIKKPRRSLQKKEKGKKQQYKKSKESEEENVEKDYLVGDSIKVKDFAELIDMPINTLIMKLMSNGIMANLNQDIDFETAYIIAEEVGITINKEEKIDEMMVLEEEFDQEDEEKDLLPRPPIVTVMGHVDHGKTSLLDAIRNTKIMDTEAGGITQHIGASVIEVNDKLITFLDTPGHEAFTSMRSRGAKVTDIAILVVAADDGIMPQTIEAINHAKAAKVPIIVAINKIDKPNINIDRVKQELSEQGLLPEDWGGETICVEVSALKRIGIDELLEMVLLVAEVEELKANPNRLAKGTIIEAKLDKGRGTVATALIEKGTLHKGDFVITGTSYGKVRVMLNSRGKRINTAGPSMPVEITGLSEVPEAGDVLYAVKDERLAKDLVEKKKQKQKDESNKVNTKVSLDDLFSRIQAGEIKDLNIIVKADVKGSIEAVKQSLEKLSIEEVKVNTIHGGVGGINETDIMLASASNAIVIGFNVRPTSGAIELAKRENVDIRTYRVIYHAIEDIEAAIKGMLDPEFKENVIGRAEIRATFKVPNAGTVAGIYVLQGKITRKSKIRLLRNEIVIHEGDISSLKRFKDDAAEINTGYEGGLGIEKFNDLKEGDIIEAYIMEEIKR